MELIAFANKAIDELIAEEGEKLYLKPCPFCGGSDLVFETVRHYGCNTVYMRVACQKIICLSSGGEVVVGEAQEEVDGKDLGRVLNAMQRAREVWNRRTTK